jgi:hypothetical protein
MAHDRRVFRDRRSRNMSIDWIQSIAIIIIIVAIIVNDRKDRI